MGKGSRFASFTILFALLLVSGIPAAAAPVLPLGALAGNLDQRAARITSGLKDFDFEVHEGYFALWGAEQCLPTYELMGTCFFNNPTAPYLLPVLPYWPEEFVDPATKDAFGETRDGFGASFRLDPNEAIVIFGYLPPEAHYFGLQSYTFTHKGMYSTDNDAYRFIASIGAKDVFFHKVPQNQERIGFFNSLSNDTNNVVIERQSGASWNQLRYFIITPDRHMDRQIRQALHKLDVASKDVFTEGIPSNVRIGLDADADDFMTGLRYSMPLDGGGEGTPSDQWRHDPTLKVLRIRDTWPNRPEQRFKAWEVDSPEERTGVPEGYLGDDLTRLVHKVAETWGQPCTDGACSTRSRTFIDTQIAPFGLVGPRCAEIGMDCQADNQDASYQFAGGLTFDNNEVWAVVGTLGTATGNATYMSLGVNNFRMRLGAKNVDYTKLEGSADAAFYPGPGNPDKFFVYYFTRDCSGLTALTHGFCTPVEPTELVIPPGDRASFTERDYIVPGTQRGPDSALLLPSRLLRLTRPALR